MDLKKILILLFLSLSCLSVQGFTPDEKMMRAKEADYVLSNKEYLNWDEYVVERVFRYDGLTCNFPIPHSFSGNEDYSYTKEYALVIGRKVRTNIYKLLNINEENTGHLVEIKYGSIIEGQPAILRFYSGSVKRPSFCYENMPTYYTTQFYRLYVP